MNHDLNRRVAEVKAISPVASMTADQMKVFIKAVGEASDFDQLEPRYQQLIQQAEANRGGLFGEKITGPGLNVPDENTGRTPDTMQVRLTLPLAIHERLRILASESGVAINAYVCTLAVQASKELVITIGAEGDIADIYRTPTSAGGWVYHDAAGGVGDSFSQLADALASVDHFWFDLYPICIHPEYRSTVWKTVENEASKLSKERRENWEHFEERWKNLCDMSKETADNA